ncbi:MAG: hypothetical protein ACOC33_03225 [bacterium]
MKTLFKNFEITSKFSGTKIPLWNDGYKYKSQHHKVTVKNTENGKSTSFDFWSSIAQPVFESEYDLLNAFYCFVSDALSGEYEAEEFLSEFGYLDGENIKHGLRAHKECQRSLAKLNRIYDGDIYNLSNELSEVAR